MSRRLVSLSTKGAAGAHFRHHNDFLRPGPLQAEVDADRGEDKRNETAVHLRRILVNEMFVFDDLQERDEHPANRAPKYDLLRYPSARS